MIDLTREKLITLKQAAALVPSRKGKTVSARTVYHWCRVGHEGRKLESVRRPSGEWLTTAEALGRFLRGVKEADERPQPDIEARERAAALNRAAGW